MASCTCRRRRVAGGRLPFRVEADAAARPGRGGGRRLGRLRNVVSLTSEGISRNVCGGFDRLDAAGWSPAPPKPRTVPTSAHRRSIGAAGGPGATARRGDRRPSADRARRHAVAHGDLPDGAADHVRRSVVAALPGQRRAEMTWTSTSGWKQAPERPPAASRCRRQRHGWAFAIWRLGAMRPTIVTFLPVASKPCALYVGAGGFGRPEPGCPRIGREAQQLRPVADGELRVVASTADDAAAQGRDGLVDDDWGCDAHRRHAADAKPVAADRSGRDNFAVCAPMADANRAASTPSVARTTATCPPASVSKHNDLIASPSPRGDGTCRCGVFEAFIDPAAGQARRDCSPEWPWLLQRCRRRRGKEQ